MNKSDQFSFLIKRLWQSTVVFAAMGSFIRIGANLLLLPLVTKLLSPKELALWWVFVALGNFAYLADFGLGAAITRVYSFFWAGAEDFKAEGLISPTTQNAAPNETRIWELHVTVQRLYGFLSLGAMIILGIVGSIVLWKPIHGVGTEAGKVWLMWGMYLLAIAYNFWAGHWLLAAQGTNRVREMHLSYIIGSISYLFVTAILLWNGWGLFSMVIATVLRGVILSLSARHAFRKAVPHQIVGIKPQFSILSRLWPNAWKFGVLSLGGYFIGNASVLISSHYLGDKITASVGLTNQVVTFIGSFAGLWLNVKWPQIAILRTQGKLMEMSVLFAKRFALVIMSYFVLSLLVLFLGNPLLEWKGSVTRLLPLPYFVLYLVYFGIQTFYVQFGSLTYTENIVPFFKISLFTGVGLVSLSLLLTPVWGLWGLLLAPLMAELVCSSWFTVKRGFQGQALKVSQFIRVAFFLHP